MTLIEAKKEAAEITKRTKTKKLYIILCENGDVFLDNAPLPGKIHTFLNGVEIAVEKAVVNKTATKKQMAMASVAEEKEVTPTKTTPVNKSKTKKEIKMKKTSKKVSKKVAKKSTKPRAAKESVAIKGIKAGDKVKYKGKTYEVKSTKLFREAPYVNIFNKEEQRSVSANSIEKA